MKNKIVYVFFTVAVLLCCFAFSAFAGLDIDKDEIANLDKIENLYECISKGDVDDNGQVDANDARIILRASVDLEPLNDEALLNADIDGDGTISSNDARLALRLAVGLEKFPEHNVCEMVIVPATCSTEGLTVRVCMSCMKIYAKVTVPASTDLHIPGAWKTAVEATCIDKGLKQIKCLACDNLINEAEIPATGKHSGEWSYPDGKDCYDYVEKTRTCTVCGEDETKVENPPLKHNYKWITEQKNTCTEDGFQVNKCSHCGEINPNENNKVLKALGHEYDSSAIIEAASCTETGLKEGICAFCGPVTEELPALGHKVAKWETAKKASCAEAGIKEGTCSVCKEAVTSEIAKLKHNFNDKEIHWTDGIPCEGTGIGYVLCTKCNEKQYGTIKKLSCTNKEPGGINTRVLAEATCTEAKVSVDVCDYCEKDIAGTQKTTGKPLGHDYSESSWTDTKPATCTEAGSRERQCSRCPEIEHASVPATGHTPGEVNVVTPATCHEAGSEEVKCSVCLEIIETREIEKLEHIPERIIKSDSGTTDEEGNYIIIAQIVCSECQEVISEEEPITRIRIAAIGEFAEDFAVTFSNDIDVSAGGKVEFTLTSPAANMLIMIMDSKGDSIYPNEENGVYSFTIPATFGEADTVTIQIYSLPNN